MDHSDHQPLSPDDDAVEGAERPSAPDDFTTVIDVAPAGGAPTTVGEAAPVGKSPTGGATRPASVLRSERGRGAHRAKVSWVGTTEANRSPSRRSWLERLTHAVTAPPGQGGSAPAAEQAEGEQVGGEWAAAQVPGQQVAEDAQLEPASEDAALPQRDPAESADENAALGRTAAPVAGPPGATEATAPATAEDSRLRDQVVFVRAGTAAASPASLAGGEGQPVAHRRSPVIATLTGVGIGLVALACFYAGPPAVLVLTSLILGAAMAECYRALQRARYQPAVALGLVGAPGVGVAAYFGGPAAIALVSAFMVVATFCWYLAGITRRSPVVNLSATLMGWAWIGLLGGFAGLLLEPTAFPHRRGLAFVLGAGEATVAYDVGGYLFGSWLGKRPMLPRISPKKTWEGLIGGCVSAFVVSVALVSQMSPWSYGRGAVLGLVVVVVAPLGDLVESMVKRDLGLKDMGRLLPAHGGVLDRIDGLLFALPATYCLVRLLHW